MLLTAQAITTGDETRSQLHRPWAVPQKPIHSMRGRRRRTHSRRYQRQLAILTSRGRRLLATRRGRRGATWRATGRPTAGLSARAQRFQCMGAAS